MILDTNAVSALADGAPPSPPFSLAPTNGINQSRHRLRYQVWLAELISVSRVLDVDRFTTDSYAAIRSELKTQGQPIPANDLWIAALARQALLPLLSRDHHFDAVPGLKRLSWP